jgi:hypothetical protein
LRAASTGHPGVPEREQSRIGLVLALEFGSDIASEIHELGGKRISEILVKQGTYFPANTITYADQ